jgi:hypothetical protein
VSNRYPVVLLPGGVLPAKLAYAPLLERLGDRVDAVAKDLEINAADEPTSGSTPRSRGLFVGLTLTVSAGSMSSATRPAARCRSR